jgi:hypothetical protein
MQQYLPVSGCMPRMSCKNSFITRYSMREKDKYWRIDTGFVFNMCYNCVTGLQEKSVFCVTASLYFFLIWDII